MEQSISDKVKEIQEKTRKVLELRNQEMIRLRREGKTFTEIGNIFGLTRQRIQRIFEKLEG